METLDFTNVKRIALDETSSRRGHQYVTLFVDSDSKRVMFATEGKDSSTLNQFKAFLKDKGIPPEQIEEACCDMSPSFISGIEDQFPKAHITFDKFHIMKMVNKALDDVRRQEQAEQPILKKTRYLWLKNQGNLTETTRENG
jgi:transposase